MRRYTHLFLLFTLMLTLLSACIAPSGAPVATPAAVAESQAVVGAPATNLTEGCVDAFDPNVDYFPEKISLTHTTGFSVEYHNSYKVITVATPWPGAGEAQQYVLVQCGAPEPTGFDAAQIIEVPVQQIATMSTSYLPFLEAYNLLDRLVAVDDVTYVNNPTVLAMAEAGTLVQIGYGAGVNVEQILDLAPDLVMT